MKYRNALTIQEKQLGKHHKQVANTLLQLGEVLMSIKDFDGCEEVLYRALMISEDRLGKFHPLSAFFMERLCHILKVGFLL